MSDFKNEVVLFLSKIWFTALLILLGIIAKFSYDVSIKKKFTFATFLSTLFLAAFVGYLASEYCDYKAWDKAKNIIVPIATLLSEGIIKIIVLNGHRWLKKYLTPPKDED